MFPQLLRDLQPPSTPTPSAFRVTMPDLLITAINTNRYQEAAPGLLKACKCCYVSTCE